MPKYIDHHKAPNLPPEAVQKMVADVKAGKVDQFGVKGLNAFISKTDAWCLTEAANAEAVHKTHEVNYGLKLGPGDVQEVMSLV